MSTVKNSVGYHRNFRYVGISKFRHIGISKLRHIVSNAFCPPSPGVPPCFHADTLSHVEIVHTRYRLVFMFIYMASNSDLVRYPTPLLQCTWWSGTVWGEMLCLDRNTPSAPCRTGIALKLNACNSGDFSTGFSLGVRLFIFCSFFILNVYSADPLGGSANIIRTPLLCIAHAEPLPHGPFFPGVRAVAPSPPISFLCVRVVRKACARPDGGREVRTVP